MANQINLKIPENLMAAAQRYVESFGFRNIQELALESIREKVFEQGEYDEEISEREIGLVDRLASVSLKKKALGTEKDLQAALR